MSLKVIKEAVHVLRVCLKHSRILRRDTSFVLPSTSAACQQSGFWTSSKQLNTSNTQPDTKTELVEVTFQSDDKDYKTSGKEGDSLLNVVFDRNIPLDGFGACEGTLACSTCHVVMKREDYDRLPEPCEEEMDMLDLAYELEDTSRLGCQIELTKEMNGLVVKVPTGTSDARS